MTYKNTACIDLDSLKQWTGLEIARAYPITDNDTYFFVSDVRDLLARRAEPSVTEAWLYICKKPGESRTYASVDENDTHHWPLDQWKSVEKIPLVRAALASPAVSQSTSKEADDYKLIAHLIGIIFFAGDFKAETANERQLEALLIKTGHRYRSWAEIDALVSVTQQAVSQKDGAADFLYHAGRVYPTRAATTASASERKKFDDHFGEGSWEACEKADAARRATAPSRDAAAALQKLCDQIDGMRRTMFLRPGTGQHYSYLVHEDVSAYIEEARAALDHQGTAQGENAAALAQVLREFVDYHTTPAGMTLETALNTDKLGEFLEGVEGREKAMVQRAQAALARAPLPAEWAPDLHDAIMRLPDNGGGYEGRERTVYKIGHRDARHAAAELSLAAPAQAGDALDVVRENLILLSRKNVGGSWMRSDAEIVRQALAAMSASQDKKPESK